MGSDGKLYYNRTLLCFHLGLIRAALLFLLPVAVGLLARLGQVVAVVAGHLEEAEDEVGGEKTVTLVNQNGSSATM